MPFASSALMDPITKDFVAVDPPVHRATTASPWCTSSKGQRKDDVAHELPGPP